MPGTTFLGVSKRLLSLLYQQKLDVIIGTESLLFDLHETSIDLRTAQLYKGLPNWSI